MRDLTYVPEDGIVTYTKTDKIKSKSSDGQYVAYEVEKQEKPLVRCKDCRYFKKIVERSDSGLCHRDIVASAWKENGYCSRGERKVGGDDDCC